MLEIIKLRGKKCQNAEYNWHKYPNTRLKTDIYPDSDDSTQTFVVMIKGTNSFGIFCYRCLFGYIGKCINDLKKNGATKEEIKKFCNVEFRNKKKNAV